MALKEKGIAAEFLSSSQTTKVRDKVNKKLGYIICVLNLCYDMAVFQFLVFTKIKFA